MEEEQIDRISKLPDEVLTRILSFVPVEDVAARAKLVSKAWKKLCEFSFDPPLGFVYPVCSFFSTPIPIPEDIDHDIGSFINGVDSSLKSHDSRLGRLILCLDLDYIESRGLIDSWIDAALERKVVHLHLRFRPHYGSNLYHLSPKVFGTRSITVLRLEECRFEIRGDVLPDLPALRKLHLRRIECDEEEEKEEAIQKLISSCPSIQDLTIISCRLQKQLRLLGLSNLQRLCVDDCYGLETIVIIDAPNLQSLEYTPGGSLILKSAGEFLREFVVSGLIVPENFIQIIASRFPNLERLKINCSQWNRIEISDHQLKRLERLEIYCDRWERIEILHHQLKRLDLTLICRPPNDAMFKFDTPNLHSLRYDGYRSPLTSLLSSLINASSPSLQELDITFVGRRDYTHFSILQLQEFFEKMKHRQHMKVHLDTTYNRTNLIIPKLRQILSPPVYDIKHLSLLLPYYSSRYHHYMIDRILWMCHPQTLSISPRTNSHFLKILYNKLMNKEEHPRCCISRPIKCWQHYLEEVQIDGDKSKFEIDKIMKMPDSSHTYMECEYEVRFTLKWRSQPI